MMLKCRDGLNGVMFPSRIVLIRVGLIHSITLTRCKCLAYELIMPPARCLWGSQLCLPGAPLPVHACPRVELRVLGTLLGYSSSQDGMPDI